MSADIPQGASAERPSLWAPPQPQQRQPDPRSPQPPYPPYPGYPGYPGAAERPQYAGYSRRQPQPQPRSMPQPQHPVASADVVPEGGKSFIVTLLLAYLLGMFGADRFYLGKTRSALLKLVTFGGFGYWWLIDVLITLFGGQRDAQGLRLNGHARLKKRVWIVIGAIFGASLALGFAAALAAASFTTTGLTPLGWVLVAILAGAAAAGGVIWMLRRRASAKRAKATRQADPVPARIRALLERLTALRAAYVTRVASGDRVATGVIGQIDALTSNVTALFERLTVAADRAQRGLAESEYEDKLGKLAAALDRGYLLDVLANPRYWEQPEERIRDVRRAIDEVDAQIVDNIKQVNARRGLVFQAAIDGLIPSKAMEDWQRDFDEAAGMREP